MGLDSRRPKIAIFGASLDTGNRGVSALFASTIDMIARRAPLVDCFVFDNQLGRRVSTYTMADGQSIELTHLGARAGLRYYRPENLAVMSLAAMLGHFGASINPNIAAIDACDAILDISAGDSFSDLYGAKRFLSVLRPKLIAISRQVPLILLPQTYGPYTSLRFTKLACKVVRSADMAWARDKRSFNNLKNLLGDSFDPTRHKCGVDMAFGLNPRPAADLLNDTMRSWLSRVGSDGPLIGLNISGLIYHDPQAAKSKFHLKADYRTLICHLAAELLDRSGSRLILVPHVMAADRNYESDYSAAMDVIKTLPLKYHRHVAIAPTELDQSQVKWLISKLDWFCGTRMHSTIAALSSGTPAAGIAYSDKMVGVFESCGQGHHVVDSRKLNSPEAVKALGNSFKAREETRILLEAHLSKVKQQVEYQMDAIVGRIFDLNRIAQITL